MATTLSSLPIAASGALGFRRNSLRLSHSIKAVSPISSRSHIGSGFRFGNALKLHKHRRGRSGFASEIDPTIEPSNNANKSTSSSYSDRPPIGTILAGIVVFLLFLWIIGSIVMWIIGLVINVPKS